MTLGKYLKIRRIKLDLTLEQASKATGISIASISKHENGLVTPSGETLEKYASGYGIRLNALTEPYHDSED